MEDELFCMDLYEFQCEIIDAMSAWTKWQFLIMGNVLYSEMKDSSDLNP